MLLYDSALPEVEYKLLLSLFLSDMVKIDDDGVVALHQLCAAVVVQAHFIHFILPALLAVRRWLDGWVDHDDNRVDLTSGAFILGQALL